MAPKRLAAFAVLAVCFAAVASKGGLELARPERLSVPSLQSLGGHCDEQVRQGLIDTLADNLVGNRSQALACVGASCPDGSPCVWLLLGDTGAASHGACVSKLLLIRSDGSPVLQAEVEGEASMLVRGALFDETGFGFSGFQGLALSPDGEMLVVAERATLFQDWGTGTLPPAAVPTRLSFYRVSQTDRGTKLELTKTIVREVPGEERDSQAAQAATSTSLIGALWAGSDQLLLVENSVTHYRSALALAGNEQKLMSRSATRLYSVDSLSLLKATEVSQCKDLSKCRYAPVEARYLATLQNAASVPSDHHPVSAAWGPPLSDGRRLLVTTSSMMSAATRALPRPQGLVEWLHDNHECFGLDSLRVVETMAYNPFIPLVIGRWIFLPFLAIIWIIYFFRYPMKLGGKLNPATSTFWQRNKLLVVTFAHLRSLLVSGVVFGYPALEIILRAMNVYGEGCIAGALNCSSQVEGFGAISLAGFLTNTAGRPLWGYALDFIGPRWTSTSGMVISCIGIAALLPASAAQPYWYPIGWALLGFGGASIHLANFHIQNLFPENKKPVAASFTVTFALSAIIFTFVAIAYDAGFSWVSIISTYLIITAIVTVCSWFLQPRQNINRDGRSEEDGPVPELQGTATLGRKSGTAPSKGELLDADVEEQKERISAVRCTPAVKAISSVEPDDENGDWGALARVALTSGKYWSETSWFWIGTFEYQWYIGTLAAQILMIPIPGANINQAVRIQATYVQEANLYNAICGLAWPISAYLLARFESLVPTIAFQLLTTVIYAVAQSIPSFSWLPVAFIFQAISRFVVCAAHHAYLSTEFPIKIFGVLNSVSYLVGTIATLCVLGLQLITTYYLGGDWYIVNYAIAAINAAAFLVIGFRAIVECMAPSRTY